MPIKYEVSTHKEQKNLNNIFDVNQNKIFTKISEGERKMESKTNETIEKERIVQTNSELNNNDLKIGIGTKESVSLKPALVTILNVEIQEVGTKNARKLVCFCSHPDKADGISISSIKWENKGKLEITGLWLNKDEDGLLRKKSALATFLENNNVQTAEQLVNKQIPTQLDEKGYLCFKNY